MNSNSYANYRKYDQLRRFPSSTVGTKFLYRDSYPMTPSTLFKASPIESDMVTSWTQYPEMKKSFFQPLNSSKHHIRNALWRQEGMGMCQCGKTECNCLNMAMPTLRAPPAPPAPVVLPQNSTPLADVIIGVYDEGGDEWENEDIIDPQSQHLNYKSGGSCDISSSNSAGGGTCSSGGGSCSCGNAGGIDLLDPKFNLREVAKHSILLEDHLFQKEKRCPDCIRKHLMTIEAFLEEAITLDKEGLYTFEIEQMLQDVKNASLEFVQSSDFIRLGQRLRALRKTIMNQGDIFECGYRK